MQNKRCLITGAGGSIASQVLLHFLEKTEWEIIGIDSFRHKGWTDRIIEILGDNEDWRKRFTLITHDLTAPISPLMAKKIGKIDYIINLASLSDVEASINNPVPFCKNNVDLVLSMLEYAREAKPEVFIQFSTDEVYGASSSKYDDLRKEWDPIVPSNPYAASKAAQEAFATSWWRTYRVPLILINVMNNFSPLQQSSKFPVMVQKAIMEGKVLTIHGKEGEIGSRSYLHSKNAADAVLFVLNNLPPHMHIPLTADRPDRYHVAGDKQLDNLELAKIIADLMDRPLKYRFLDAHSARSGHDPHYGLDMSLLASKGWKSPSTFEESMKQTIDWQSAHPQWISLETHDTGDPSKLGHESYDKSNIEENSHQDSDGTYHLYLPTGSSEDGHSQSHT